MAPEFGDTQVLAPQAPSVYAPVHTDVPTTSLSGDNDVTIEDTHLPSMADLDELVADLDRIDATLAEIR